MLPRSLINEKKGKRGEKGGHHSMVSPFFPVYIVAFLQHPQRNMRDRGTPVIEIGEIGGHDRISDMERYGDTIEWCPHILMSLYLIDYSQIYHFMK